MLGLDWPEWGETDVALGLAAEDVDASMCSCGCGYPSEMAHDPAVKDRVVVESETCHVRAAVADYCKKMKPDADQVLTTRLLREGETREDVARSAYEALRARFPQPDPTP